MIVVALALAHAADVDPVSLHGDAKTFAVALFPYESPLMPPHPTGQASAALRLRGAVRTERVDLDLHHEAVAGIGPAFALGPATGVGAAAPEALKLSWQSVEGEGGLRISGRTDRFSITVHGPRIDVTAGRQPISFGSGLFFTPLDLVNPFAPTTLDTEHKPGVDAARVDVYAGTSTQVTVAAAYAGDWNLRGTVLAAHARTTVGVTDLALFFGEVHADEVFGGSVLTSAGPVGLHGDVAVTIPDPADESPFVRAVVGADGRPHEKLTLSGELYLQTFGATDPADVADIVSQPRFARGEVWTTGVLYGAVSAAVEVTPIVGINGVLIANLTDPSGLAMLSLSWSVSDEATIGAGVMTGIGERPEGFVPRSELGVVPVSGWASTRAYF